ncbi:MAG: tRNA-modifying protein YgfZ [Chthoniobacter sp.]|jgi:folate-binding protein YgfZ|nr:tRNA-modifying protein YgfZ [Chthoniobacter sp.]
MRRADLYAEAKERGGLIDLSRRAKWRVTGADRVRFLNGQVSNDVRKLAPGTSLHACVLTAKGKMSGDVFISAEPDFLRMDTEPVLREAMSLRLERYIVADDVALEDVTDEFALVHLVIGSAKLMPSGIAGVTQTNAHRFAHPGIDLLMPGDALGETWRALSEDFAPLDDSISESLRIEAGVPRWGAELGENTIPTEAGLDRVAVDFHKGCYIGQEIVSRIKSGGHVNRALHGFVSQGALAVGMELFAAGSEQPVGKLTSAGWSFGLEKYAALGYLKRGVEADIFEARAQGASAQKVEARPLPLIP